MRRFFAQLGWEFYKLAARRRTWIPFAAALLFEFVMSRALRSETVRVAIARDLWKMRWRFDEAFSGLTTAAHIFGEAATIIGGFGVVLVAADLVAKESEDGTLQATLARPVSRSALLLQKLIVAAVYTLVLALFIAASALAMGLLFEGRGALVMIAPHEEIIGLFDAAEGLQRYAIAAALLIFPAFSGMVVAFAVACFDVRPWAAAAVALTLFLTDTSIRVHPEMQSVRAWCVTTHQLAWRQAFNEVIPWTRIRRSYAVLACWDAAWLAAGWWAFRRRDITR